MKGLGPLGDHARKAIPKVGNGIILSETVSLPPEAEGPFHWATSPAQ